MAPLRHQLVELEGAMMERRDRLSGVKANMLRNEARIGRLLGASRGGN